MNRAEFTRLEELAEDYAKITGKPQALITAEEFLLLRKEVLSERTGKMPAAGTAVEEKPVRRRKIKTLDKKRIPGLADIENKEQIKQAAGRTDGQDRIKTEVQNIAVTAEEPEDDENADNGLLNALMSVPG